MKSLREYLNMIEQINESPMPMVGGVEFAENDNDDDDRTPAEQLQSMILHRIMMQHPDLLRQHGPAAVMDAAEDAAEAYGDYEEMGTSDISALVNNVARSLGQE